MARYFLLLPPLRVLTEDMLEYEDTMGRFLEITDYVPVTVGIYAQRVTRKGHITKEECTAMYRISWAGYMGLNLAMQYTLQNYRSNLLSQAVVPRQRNCHNRRLSVEHIVIKCRFIEIDDHK